MAAAGRFRRSWPAVLALAAAVGFWIVLLGQAERSVFGRVPVLDEAYYLDRAAADVSREPHFMSPLYPELIRWTGYRPPAGDDLPDADALRGLRWLQIGCWLGTAALLRLLAGCVLGPMVPAGWRRRVVTWLPPLLFVLYRPAAVFAVSVLLDMPLAFLLTGFVALVTVARGAVRGTVARGVALGLGLGLVIGTAAVLRGTALVLAPLGIAALAAGRPARWAWPASVALAAGVVMVLAQPVLHNTRLVGRPVGPALNGGVNLYIGNGPQANGFYVNVVPGDWRHDPAGRDHLAERQGRPDLTLAEADALWRDAALEEMGRRPLRTAGLWARKVWLHLQGWEIDQLTPLSGWTRAAPALRLLVVPYALLSVLGLLGVFALGRPGAPRWWASALLLLLAVQSVFFVVSRYRLALVPLLALLGGWALARWWQAPHRRFRSVLVLAAAVLMVVPWGLGAVRQEWRGLGAANEAMCWYEIARRDGDPAALARAGELYEEAAASGSTAPPVWLGLATVRLAEDRPLAGVEALDRGWSARPDNRDLGRSLFSELLRQDRRVEALVHGLEYLRRHPRDPEVLHGCSVLLDGLLRREAALVMARRLLAEHPGDPRGYNDLGVLLAREGRREEARAVFEAGLARFPEHRDLTVNRALVADEP